MSLIADNTTPRLLRLRGVLALLGISKSRFYLGIKRGEFPVPIRLTPRTSAWSEAEILDLIRRATEARDGA